MIKRFLFSLLTLIAIGLTMAIYVSRNQIYRLKYDVSLPGMTTFTTLTPSALLSVTPIPASPTPVVTATPSPSPVPFSFYAPTVNMGFEELIGDNGNYNLPIGYPSSNTYRIVVDKTFQVVIVYEMDESGQYSVPVRYMLCSTSTKTPEGIFSMKRYRVRFGFFQNDKTYGQYWSLINGRIYFHSVLYSERNNASSYLEEPYEKLGTPASHGCIRLTVPDARFIFYNAAYGTEVEIRAGDPDDEETRKIRDNLILPPVPEERVIVSPDLVPDTDNWKIETVKIEIPYEEGSQKGQE